VDNGEGVNRTYADLISWPVFTDGTDIGATTVDEVVAMGPAEYLEWLASLAGVPLPDDLLSPATGGNVQIR
jgi:hypothetical protein